MTTPRIRRNKSQQAQDVLRALLKDQGHKAKRLKEMYEEAETEAAKTRRALESLGMEPLPGMEVDNPAEGMVSLLPPEVRIFGSGGSGGANMGTEPFNVSHNALKSVETWLRSAPAHRREGHVDDVWSAKDGASTRAHTQVMYERQDRCQLCKEGIPFASQARTEHYVVLKDDRGIERGFEYKPCKGSI